MELRHRSIAPAGQAFSRGGTWGRVPQLAFLLSLAFAVGCSETEGPTKFPLTGTVTREGEPMAEGIITMTPSAGGPATQAKITEGTYEFSEENGPVEGEHEVTILRVLKKGPIPPGGVAKDADYLPETGFDSPMPGGGWVLKTTISPDQDVSEPVDFNVDNAQPATGRGSRR